MTGDDLEDLLDLWEEARDRGEPVSPEVLCRDRPDLLEELARLVAELRKADAFLDGTADPERTTPQVFSADANQFQAAVRERYHDERFLAEGGLGRVFVARDAELPREVALKRLQDRMAGSREGRRRFVLEAEITARLEHPGVVPVYGLGTDRQGQPFYAMRLIRGETMGRAIERFHAADTPGRDPGERHLALQSLLRAFLATCQTVAYAHSRGVIHRDLKPSNVMLGPYGEALVVDWGLAKPLDAADDIEDLPWPSRDSPWDATSAGTIKGSPAYMSPEQAEGRVDRVGPASDVYSLGATLYTLLTGVRPITGESITDVLMSVREGRFAPPRRVKAGVPRALEAVCLKAMRVEPAERYEGASELAVEVERWLSGEPVLAWREPWYDRLRRWGRRHRVVVASVAAAVVMGAVILAVTNGILRDLAGRLDKSNVSLRAALDDAETNLYARDIDLADRAWWDGQTARAGTLLEECPRSRRGWEWRYLARRNQVGLSSAPLSGPPEALGLTSAGAVVAISARDAAAYGASGAIRLAAVTTDGTKVAFVTSERPSAVVVADPSGRSPASLVTPGVAGNVEGLAFSADGRSIVLVVVKRASAPATTKDKISFVSEFEARLVVRALETGKEEISEPFHASGTPGVPTLAWGGRCFCPVTFGESASLYAGRPGSSPVEQAWSGNGPLVISPDGFRLAGRGEGNVVIVREVASGAVVATFRGHTALVRALAFSPDGTRLASASDDRTIRVWEIGQGKSMVVLRGQAGPVDRLAFSADGTRMASASAVDVVLWDRATTSEARVVRTLERPHLSDLAAAPGGRAAVVAGHQLSWRDTATGRASDGGEVADIEAVASAPRGGWTAAGAGDGSIVLLDAEDRPARTLKGHATAIAGLSFSWDGHRLCSAARDGDVRVWEAATGRQIAQFAAGPVVALSPDGESAAAGGEGEVFIFDAARGVSRHRLAGSGAAVRTLSYNSDGALIAVVRSAGHFPQPSGGDDLAVFDAATGQLRYACGDQPAGVTAAVFSPDGQRLASADRAGQVVIREASSGRPLLTLHGPADRIARLAFTRDGNRLLAAGGRVDPLGLRSEEAEEFTIWDGRPLD
jgi:WD40 repeat protein